MDATRIITPEHITKYTTKSVELEDGTKLRMNKDARLNDYYTANGHATTTHTVFGFNKNQDISYRVTRTVDLTTLEILCITVVRIEFI